MSTLDERTAYEKNPYFTGHIYGNFSPFYVTIAICTILLAAIILINVILGCCSKYRNYWQDRHTGNRWLVSIWSDTPHKQPPLDFTELKGVSYFQSLQPAPRIFQTEDIEAVAVSEEVPIHQPYHHHQQQQHHQHHQRPSRSEGRVVYHQRQREEYVQLQKREIAALALFIVGVIIIMLRFGPKLCGLRHHALDDNDEWHERVYEHEISYA